MDSGGDNTKSMSPGDRWTPTADGINSWNEAGRYVRGLGRGGGAIATPGVTNNPAIITIKNNSGSTKTRFDVLGIDDILITPSDNVNAFSNRFPLIGVTPTTDHAGRFCVLLEPLEDGKLGRAVVVGVVPARVYVNSYTDTFCDVVATKTVGSESTSLSSGSKGAQILWWEAADQGDNGTIVWAVVRLGGSGGGELTVFEVKTSTPAFAPAPGITYDAWSLTWDEDNQKWNDPIRSNPTDLTVIDGQGRWLMLRYEDTKTGANPGALRGFCDQNGNILWAHEMARIIGGAVATATPSWLVTSLATIYSIDGGLLPHATTLNTTNQPGQPPLGGITNVQGYNGSDAVFVWDQKNHCYKPIQIDQPLCQRVTGTIQSFMGRTTPTITVNAAALHATSVGTIPSGNQTITNPGYCCDGGTTFWAEWDIYLGQYRIYDVSACSTNSSCG